MSFAVADISVRKSLHLLHMGFRGDTGFPVSKKNGQKFEEISGTTSGSLFPME